MAVKIFVFTNCKASDTSVDNSEIQSDRKSIRIVLRSPAIRKFYDIVVISSTAEQATTVTHKPMKSLFSKGKA